MGADRRYLEWHGNQWRVQVKVPAKARAVLGKQRLVEPLHTDSLANANRLKFRVVAHLKDIISRAEVEADRRARGQTDALLEEAFSWRIDIEREAKNPDVDEEGRELTVAADVLLDRAEEVERTHGPERSSYFYKVARGLVTPILSLVDAWLAERIDMKARQRIDYRRAVAKFEAWLVSESLSGAIEVANRKLAGRYVSEAMVAKGAHWKTANKDISALSQYWKWLLRKGHVSENIWANQSLPKIRPKSDAQRPKRPFTDAEVERLIKGVVSDPLLRDAVLIAALSGMRNDEIARLKVGDCAGGVFSIKDAKTAAGVRDVPIHAKLISIVAERCAGKASEAYLFHELKNPTAGSAMERGQPITKKFVQARRRLGVDERLPGSRQSRIDFHSFRRWFVAKARDALQNGAKGFDQWTISEVVGHDKETSAAGLGMTMGRYAGAQSAAARRACVASVRLPDPTPSPMLSRKAR